MSTAKYHLNDRRTTTPSLKVTLLLSENLLDSNGRICHRVSYEGSTHRSSESTAVVYSPTDGEYVTPVGSPSSPWRHCLLRNVYGVSRLVSVIFPANPSRSCDFVGPCTSKAISPALAVSPSTLPVLL